MDFPFFDNVIVYKSKGNKFYVTRQILQNHALVVAACKKCDLISLKLFCVVFKSLSQTSPIDWEIKPMVVRTNCDCN